ncbi:MAG: glycosyltransferase family 2 protein [Bacteroidales bacterium]|nr:glycosyltransferase family 2 protein [Bacteroidales bacterium]
MIPAYNEALNIIDVIESLHNRNADWDILVINDESHDATGKLARSSSLANVIDLPFNLGIGGCIQTGFKYAAKHGYDLAVQFDGDGQHLAGEIDKITGVILSGDVDVCIGSRFYENHSGYRSSRSRRFGIKIFGLLTRILIRQKITDCTSGFRAYNKEAISFLSENYPVDYPEPEAIILLGRNNFRIREVLTEMQDRRWGRSTITFINSPYYMIKVMLGMVMTALRQKVRR